MIQNPESEYNQLYKIIIIGDASVGKTHLVQKYVKGYVPKNPIPTVGVEFGTKIIPMPTGEKVKAQIWDTTGQEKYRAVTMSHYRNANGAIIVYDITKEKTFRDVRSWLQDIREQCDPEVEIILVGNKIDLPNRAISRAEAQQFATQENLLFEETSAMEGSINQVFEKLCASIANKRVTGQKLPPAPPGPARGQNACNC